MEYVAYLEQLQSLKDVTSLPAPPSEPLTPSLASRLWNACIRLHAHLESTTPRCVALLLDVCRIREQCCFSLAQTQSPEDMTKYWARTGKAFLDCEDTQTAAACLRRADSCSQQAKSVPPETWFYLYKWSLELAVKQDGDGDRYVKSLCDLVPALPGLRLELCYFLYDTVAISLCQRSLLASAITALNACLALAAESPKRTEEVVNKARTLLCSLYLDLQAFSKARDLLQLLPFDSPALVLRVKLLIQTEAMSGFTDLIGQVLERGAACVQDVCDLLLKSSLLVDACQLLWAAAQRFQQGELLAKWAKTLFSLVTMDPSLSDTAEYLSTSAALEAVCRNGNCEPVLPFLWNLCVERSHAGDLEGSTAVLRKLLAEVQDQEMKHNALVLLAQNQFRQNRYAEALQSLAQTEPRDSKPALLRLHVLLRMQAAASDSVYSAFACLRTTEDIATAASLVLQEHESVRDWTEVQHILCTHVTKVMQGGADSRLATVVKCAVQCGDAAVTVEYLQCALQWAGLNEEDRDWLHKRAWNLALTQPPGPLAYTLLRLAGQLAHAPEHQQRCALAACHICFTGELTSKFQEALSTVQMPVCAALLSLQREVEFEGLLVTAPGALTEHLEKAALSAQDLRTAAGAAFRLRRPDVAALCLKQLLQVGGLSEVAETAAVYRTLVTLAASGDESFCYVEQAVKVASERPYPREEVDWLLAVCWNNGVKSYRLDKLVWAERWMALALRLQEKSESAYSEQMRKVYTEVLRQRYDS